MKLRIRISLPTEYHAGQTLHAIVSAIITATGIPADETWEALLFAEGEPMGMAQRVNREGLTDGLYA